MRSSMVVHFQPDEGELPTGGEGRAIGEIMVS
jgi:hypothetical protein